jgi:predicted choloylglycine hydrolase
VIRLDAIREDRPGSAWQRTHTLLGPALHSWYAREGLHARPSLATGRAALRDTMPELVETWERLVDLADGDELTARILTMWDVPEVYPGCTQAIRPGPQPLLIRNYDYSASLLEGVVSSTDWSGRRRVMGTSDLLWGLLDGMNADGLAVSLTWGGRPGSKPGFAIPLVLRYLLETCADVPQALERLHRIPVAQAYNLSLVDAVGRHKSVFVAPGAQPEVSDLTVVANHPLDRADDSPTAALVRSPQRQAAVCAVLDADTATEDLVRTFLSEPVHSRAHSRGFGTLYTAVYDIGRGTLSYHWPAPHGSAEGLRWERRFCAPDETRVVRLTD